MRRLAIPLVAAALLGTAALVWLVALREDGGRASRGREAREEPASPEAAPPRTPDDAKPAPAPTGKPGEAPERPVTVRGRVLAGGKPVEDAFVYLRGGEEEEQIETEADGAFAFRGVGSLTLGAVHREFGPARRAVTAREGEVVEADLELPPGREVELLVVADAGGGPVGGARILVLRAGSKEGIDGANAAIEDVFTGAAEEPDLSFFAVLEPMDLFGMVEGGVAVRVAAATTDAAGRARLRGLPEGTFDAVVSHGDFVPHRVRREPIQAEREVVVRLGAGGGLLVLAPAADGRPPEGYLCVVTRPGMMPMPVAYRKLDARGEALFEHLQAGPFMVTVSKSGGGMMDMLGATVAVKVEEGEEPTEMEEPEPPLATRPVTIVAGKRTVLDLRGEEGCRILGRFVAAGKPLAEAMVMLLGGEDLEQQMGQASTGEDGAFRFENLRPGRYRLFGAGDSGGTAILDVEVPAGKREVEVTLALGSATVLGRVTGPDGAPVEGASVLLERADRPLTGTLRSLPEVFESLAGHTDTDEKGEYSIGGLAAGTYRLLCGSKGRLEAATVVVGDGGETRADVRFDPARLRRLVVRLRGPDGEPVRGQVSVTGDRGSMLEMAALVEDEEAAEVLAGGGGKETWELALPPGRYRVHASASGHASAFGRSVDLTRDQEVAIALAAGVPVTLRLAGPGGPAAGREVELRTEDGFAAGVGVSLFELFVGSRTQRSDESGVVSLPHVAPGRYTVIVDGKEALTVHVADAPLDQRVRVE